MSRTPVPDHILKLEWSLLCLRGEFDPATISAGHRRALENSARARQRREDRRSRSGADLKRRAAGDND